MAPANQRPRFWRRVTAYVLDGAVLAALGFALLGAASLLLGPTVRIELDGAEAPVIGLIVWRVLLNALLLAGLSAAYFVLSWTRVMRSPGQALLRIRVQHAGEDALPLATRRALLRWALLGAPLGIIAAASVDAPIIFLIVSLTSAAWFAVLLITTLFSRSGRGLHDRLAGSVVVRSDRG